MTIGIDIRSLASGRRSGVEEYVIRLCEELFAIDEAVSFKLFVSGLKSEHAQYRFEERFSNVDVVHVAFPNKLVNAAFRIIRQPKIDKLLGGVDVLFFPNMLFSSVSGDVPYVVTFHDLSFVHFKEFLTLKRKLWHAFVRPKALANGSAKIISVSDATKEDLVNTYGLDQGRIEVIHSGAVQKPDVTQADIDSVRVKYTLPNRFVLCFGTLEPRKNIIGLIDAFFEFQKNNPEYALVIAGEDGWKMQGELKKSLTRFAKGTILFTGFVDEEDKQAVYAASNMFAYLSFFEGFGFPLLEAAQARVPIITSAHSSLLEIIGDGALFVDPYNCAEIADAMQQVASSEDLRKDLVKKAYARIDSFSLEEAAQKTFSVLTKVAHEN